jgi:acetyltransferase
MGGRQVRNARELLVQNNIPTYETPEEAVRAYVNMFNYRRNLDLLYETPSELPERKAPSKPPLRRIIEKAVSEERTLLSDRESKAFLAGYSIPSVDSHLAGTLEEALSLAKEIGYPVVIKIASTQIL